MEIYAIYCLVALVVVGIGCAVYKGMQVSSTQQGKITQQNIDSTSTTQVLSDELKIAASNVTVEEAYAGLKKQPTSSAVGSTGVKDPTGPTSASGVDSTGGSK